MRRALICSLALLGMTPAAPARAGHVTANPQVSARLGERISDNAWAVIVEWSVNCSGPAPGSATYYGSLNLDDVGSGEVIYMGGISSAPGSDRQPVSRRTQPRRMRPRLKASCGDGGIGNHGSDTLEVTGNTVTIPGKGDENGDGFPDGSGSGRGGSGDRPGAPARPQGPSQFPGAGFGRPTDPLRRGGCAVARDGTARNDVLTGTRGPDLIFGLAGSDLIRGQGGDDCLISGPGHDRLDGQGATTVSPGEAGTTGSQAAAV